MNYNFRRYSKCRGRKIPDRAHSSFNQHIGDNLSSFSGSGDDSDENLHPLSQFAQPIDRENRLPVYFAINFVGVGVEGSDDAETEFTKTVVAKKSGA